MKKKYISQQTNFAKKIYSFLVLPIKKFFVNFFVINWFRFFQLAKLKEYQKKKVSISEKNKIMQKNARNIKKKKIQKY